MICPNCGYCPHCGRGGSPIRPVRPFRPLPYWHHPYDSVSGALQAARQAVGASARF